VCSEGLLKRWAAWAAAKKGARPTQHTHNTPLPVPLAARARLASPSRRTQGALPSVPGWRQLVFPPCFRACASGGSASCALAQRRPGGLCARAVTTPSRTQPQDVRVRLHNNVCATWWWCCVTPPHPPAPSTTPPLPQRQRAVKRALTRVFALSPRRIQGLACPGRPMACSLTPIEALQTPKTTFH
jgi:hypothetical protein